MTDCDIFVVGAGWVGLSLALALPENLKIILVERLPLKKDDKNDERAIVLSYSSLNLLKRFGVENLEAYSTPIQQVHISEVGKFGLVRLQAKRFNLPELGRSISGTLLQKALLSALESRKNVQIISPAEMLNLTVDEAEQHADVNVSGDLNSFRSRLAVIADGATSYWRSQLGFSVEEYDYQESSYVVTVTVEKKHEFTAYERFSSCGTLAFIPGKDQQGVMIYSASQDEIALLQTKSLLEIQEKLQAQFGERLGKIVLNGAGKVFPLKKVLATEQVKQGVLLLGNAAHTLHPLAAQGLNLSLRDIQALTNVLNAHKNPNIPLGALSVLERYSNQQKDDQTQVSRLTETLVYWFHQEHPLFAKLRQAALIACMVSERLQRRLLSIGLGQYV